MERTLILLKPDAVQRGIIGDILSRFEHKGLKIAGLRMLWISHALAEKHYKEHAGKPFYGSLLDFIKSGPVVALVLEGDDAIATIRKMVGATNPLDAAPGTIRHDFGMHTGRNLIHASDSKKSSEKEISLFFDIDEIMEYDRNHDRWIYEKSG
ncbi:MAG: nucleoside-diphosphate kinase [archaeon]